MTSSHPARLACRDVVELTTDFLGGGLSVVDRAHLEQHLLVCSPCTMHLRQVRAAIALTGELGAPTPAAIPSELLAAFRKSRGGES